MTTIAQDNTSQVAREAAEKWSRLHDVMEMVCNEDAESDTAMDDLAKRAKVIIVGNDKRMDENNFQYLDDCFNSCEQVLNTDDNGKEFEIIQAFILAEQNQGRARRKAARIIEATEEKRLASEIAELKGFRLKTQSLNSHEELQRKISDAERSYFSRKMVVAKSAQVANAECRLQFTHVREFFGELHDARQENLRRQYQRSLKLQAVTQRLRNTDGRVSALERQIINRLYHKKKTDLNELHMTQNMEEATYLEAMIDLLYQVQTGKEVAAREMFALHVKYLKQQRANNMRRFDELSNLRSYATKEMAKVIAHYTEDEDGNNEREEVREDVDSMERRKDFNASVPIMSVSQLYDAVLWSVATSQMSSTQDSSLYTSDFGSEEEMELGADEDDEEPLDEDQETGDQDLDDNEGWKKNENDHFSDTASTQGSTCDGSVNGGGNNGEEKSRISLLGKIHVKQLSKQFRKEEKELVSRHEADLTAERRKYRVEARVLKRKHQKVVDGLLQKCLFERHKLREGIAQRMQALENKQQEATRQLRQVIQEDIMVMQEALRAEDQRLEVTEKNSFIRAQELISSQVFHEVRNALSSMISMSEITSSLKHDSSISPSDLISSVDDMLEQIKEVVQYSLNMLNNVLDVSKIKSGSFALHNKSFDLQELVASATRMQLAKAGGVKMSFVSQPGPCIVYSDNDLIIRIVTNFISNAIKFTSKGAIQPFVWCVDDMFGSTPISSNSSVASGEFIDDVATSMKEGPDNQFLKTNNLLVPSQMLDVECASMLTDDDDAPPQVRGCMKLLAVGVADTGKGLNKEKLGISESGLTSSDTDSMVSCVRNSGFGLHLAHLLAKALGSKLHLTSLEQCRHLLNNDMLKAMDEYPNACEEVPFRSRSPNDMNDKGDCTVTTVDISTECDTDGLDSVDGRTSVACSTKAGIGTGTVIYFTIPVFMEEDYPERDLQDLIEPIPQSVSTINDKHREESYTFCPRPSQASGDGTLRILVADDVKMLRKGVVHNLINLFPDVPLSIYTACTAEDVLRATSSYPFDIVICDNQFFHEDNTTITAFSREEELAHGRPRLLYDNTMSRSEFHKVLSQYFENESFTHKDGDGMLSGFEALKRIAESSNPAFPTPLLILLSGHKWDTPPSPGVVVVQKPLRQSGFFPLLESHARELLETGYCIEAKDGNAVLLNKHGSQMFVRPPSTD